MIGTYSTDSFLVLKRKLISSAYYYINSERHNDVDRHRHFHCQFSIVIIHIQSRLGFTRRKSVLLPEVFSTKL